MDAWSLTSRFLPGLGFLDSGVQEPGESTIPGTAGSAGIVEAIDGF